MKKIIELFKYDLKRIVKSKMAVVILLGMMIIPGIYAWLNIDSNWDPYDNTGNIPIAVVNQDQGVELLDEKINIGDSLVEKLETNNAMKWVFTDEDDARTKVESGDYYGAILIPEDFSSRISTLFDGEEIKKPKFDFIINDKKNPIAPIITNKAASSLQTTINQAFVEAIVLKTATKAEDANLGDKTTETINGTLTRLNEAKKGISEVRTTLNVISSATSATASALDAVKNLLPSSISSQNNSSLSDLGSVQRAATSLSNINANISNNVSSMFSASTRLSSAIAASVNSIDPNSATYQAQVKQSILLVDALNKTLTEQQKVISSMQTMSNNETLDALQSQITASIQQNMELKTMLQSMADGNTAMLDQAKSKANELNSTVNGASNYYDNTTAPNVEQAIGKATSAITDAVGSISYISSSFAKTDAALASTINALNSVSTMNANLDVMLSNLQNDLDHIGSTLGGATESDLYLKIMNLLKNTPEDIADFISNPIDAEKTEIYKIDHYGSKMAPFYTILAAWVGCTLLVAVLKTNVDDKSKNIKPYQAFLGRFMLFGVIAVCQGLVIGIGDIILGVQVLNIPLFLFAIMLSSAVFMLIVYSLAVSFGKIGEAVAVILMVTQVAGSGGTFPIELLPDFFQKFQPFMPFYPSMNAVRETVGGFYGASYLLFIALLLCHTIIPLLLGLVIRNPIIKLKNTISKDVEETDIIV